MLKDLPNPAKCQKMKKQIAKHNKSPLALDNISNSTTQNRPIVVDKTLKAGQ